jgi:DNA-binding transcriptional regulator WhiA
MPSPWKLEEKKGYKSQLRHLYVLQNKTIKEVGQELGLAESSVYSRLVRLGIPTQREKKAKYNNKRGDIIIPSTYSADLAEFVGIMLGDGSLSKTQVSVTLGTKEYAYAEYVASLMAKLFGVKAKIIVSIEGYSVVYIGSTELVKWFLKMGLVFNKVKYQVDVPSWVSRDSEYMARCLRGLLDTDGSIYKLKFGVQISFSNMSEPLLRSVRKMLFELNMKPSAVSAHRVYLTRRQDLDTFIHKVEFRNPKHKERARKFLHE